MEIEACCDSGEDTGLSKMRMGRYIKGFAWGFYFINNIEQSKKWQEELEKHRQLI